MRQQQRCHVLVALLRSEPKRRGAVVGDAAGVGPLVEQDLGDVEVVVSGCEVQRGALLNIFRLGRDTP